MKKQTELAVIMLAVLMLSVVTVRSQTSGRDMTKLPAGKAVRPVNDEAIP